MKTMLVAVVLAAFSTLLLAQQTGVVAGTVTDKTGAVVPNATVTLTNAATKDVRHVNTNGEGFFSFSGAVAGDYSVKIESQGFQSVEQPGIHLGPGDRRNLNISLAVGGGIQTITVEATASQIQVTDSPDLTSTLYTKNITNLSLQGRDVTELLKVLPGFSNNNGIKNSVGYDTTVTSIGSGVGNSITAPGVSNRAGGADLVSDGAHILDPGCACNANQTVNPDMVSEVKVATSAYGADSITGPVVVSAVGKSGSTEYHGGVYMHLRDTAMNSNDWNNNHNNLGKPNDRYLYPGGQFSGPVPLTNKKLFFFTAFEYYNQTFPEGMTRGILKANLPTMSERAGLFDPTLSDNAAMCAVVDASIISDHRRCFIFDTINTAGGTVTGITNNDVSAFVGPGAKAMLKLIPEPNRTPTAASTYNYVQPLINTNNGYMFHTKVDYNFNETTKLYVSFNQQHELYGSPVMRWWLAGNDIAWPGAASSSNISRTISGNLVKVFNSTTTNEFLAGLSFLNGPLTIGNKKAVSRSALGYPYTYPGSSDIMPSISNGWFTSGWGIPQMLDTGRIDYFSRKMQPSISDNFTKVIGTHTIKAGASWLHSGNRQANVDQGSGANGTIKYQPIWDGVDSSMSPILNMMLDHAGEVDYEPTTVSDVGTSNWGFYGQDDWKVTKRFSVNFGLRLTHDTPWVDATGKFGAAVFTRAWYDADIAAGLTSLPGVRWHAMDKSIPMAGHKLDAMNYAPRFGLAYDIFGTGKTMLRGGIGMFYYPGGVNGYDSAVGTSMGGTVCKIGSAFLSQIDQGGSCSTSNSPVGITAVDPKDHIEARTLTYNLTISQQAPMKSLFEVTYTGSQSSNLSNPLQDQNVMQIGAFAQPDPNPASASYGQYLSLQTINQNDHNDVWYLNVQQDYKPYPRYTKVNVISHSAWSNYNALQFSWSKQQGRLNYNLNYTFSKALGIGTTPDPININNDYGILGQDRTHVLNASYSYEVGNHFKNKVSAVALNGWMISGITSLQSGPPLQQWRTNLNLGGNNTQAQIGGNNYNSVNEMYYLGVAGDTKYALMPKLTCNPSKGIRSGQYVNPHCFALPTQAQFDSTGVMTRVGEQGQYQWPYLKGPAYLTSDLSLARTIKVTERQNVQIKFTAMNIFNHPLRTFDENNASNINLNYNAGVLQTQSADGTSWQYGVTNEKYGRRVLEVTMKYNF